MRISRRHFTLGVTSATLGVATASWAQSFPNKPLKIIVPFPAGGTTKEFATIAHRLLVALANAPKSPFNSNGFRLLFDAG